MKRLSRNLLECEKGLNWVQPSFKQTFLIIERETVSLSETHQNWRINILNKFKMQRTRTALSWREK